MVPRLWFAMAMLLAALGASRAAPKTKDYRGREEASSSARDLAKLNAVQRKALWAAWKAENGRDTADGSAEDYARYAAWSANLDALIAANQRADAAAFQGLNKFADLSAAEFAKRVLMAPRSPADLPDRAAGATKWGAAPARKLLQAPPPTFDWRTKGKVPAVRDQGSCGSCWAFAGIGALEVKAAIDGVVAAPPDASEQEMVDCVTTSSGCGGGSSADVFSYAASKMVVSEAAYPYTSGGTNTAGACRLSSVSAAGALTVAPAPGFQWVASNPQAIMQAVSAVGGVVVYFNVLRSFQLYTSGIYQASSCDATTINHAMLVVGYDVGAGVGSNSSYWIIRNSWGSGWGEGGYARVQMTADSTGACAMYGWVMLPSQTALKAAAASPPPPSPKVSPAPKPCKGRKC